MAIKFELEPAVPCRLEFVSIRGKAVLRTSRARIKAVP